MEDNKRITEPENLLVKEKDISLQLNNTKVEIMRVEDNVSQLNTQITELGNSRVEDKKEAERTKLEIDSSCDAQEAILRRTIQVCFLLSLRP